MEFLPVLKSVWTIWFLGLFAAIVIWALLPGNRERLARHAHIPLKDGPPATGGEVK